MQIDAENFQRQLDCFDGVNAVHRSPNDAFIPLWNREALVALVGAAKSWKTYLNANDLRNASAIKRVDPFSEHFIMSKGCRLAIGFFWHES